MPAGDATPNHNHIDLLSEQELDRWCNHTGDDNEHSRFTSIVVGGTFLYSLLDSDSRFPAVVALEVRGEVPSAPPEDCASSLPSSWCTLQTLTGWNDALYRICGRKLLRVPKLVIRLALNASMEEAPTTFHRNVAAFQPDTLTVYLSCTEWIEWHALEGFLANVLTVGSLPGVRRLYLILSLPANLKHISGKKTSPGAHQDALPDYVRETILPLTCASTTQSCDTLEVVHVKAATAADASCVCHWSRRVSANISPVC